MKHKLNAKLAKIAIRVIHNDLDQQLSTVEAVCKKGCSHCCHQAITVHRLEEDNIKRAAKMLDLNNKQKQTISEKLEQMTLLYNATMRQLGLDKNPADVNALMKLERAIRKARPTCPMLDKQGLCQIYRARPALCRTYLVESDPERCRTDLNRKLVPEAEKVRDDSLLEMQQQFKRLIGTEQPQRVPLRFLHAVLAEVFTGGTKPIPFNLNIAI